MLAVAALLSAPSLSAQQTATITGRVTDGTSGQPIASVQVFIQDLNLGVLTQQNGRYLLLNVPAGTHTVTAQRIGYRQATYEVTVAAGGSVVQDMSLSEEALMLDEVIVTGTVGQTQRRALGNSVERLSAADVTEQAPIANMQEMLTARTPALRFSGADGDVGSSRSITIRGVSSVLLGSQPLIYVDGVRVQNDAALGPNTGDTDGTASALGNLSPDQIESIEVIKGPSAATLYGTEASAGVIQIITKKGSVGEPEFTLEVNQGTNFMGNPQSVLGQQYACSTSDSQCNPADVVEVNLYDEASDYMRGVGRFAGISPLSRNSDLFQNGYAQRYNASVRGGIDQVRYYVSGTWGDETGVVDYNTNQQTAIRSNVTVLLGESMNLDLAAGYISGRTQFASVQNEGHVWHQLVWGSPGDLPGVLDPNGLDDLGFQERFPQDYERTDIWREYGRFTASATATHTWGDFLTQRLILGIDTGSETNNEYLPPGVFWRPLNHTGGGVTYGKNNEENLTFDYSISGSYQLTESLGTTTSFGTQYYTKKTEGVIDEGEFFPTDLQTVIEQTEVDGRTVDFSSIENKSLGFFVQEELNWEDRIYLTGAVRADDNSAFGGEFDLQYYPKVSASWVVSEESFWNVGPVNSFRLRGAWGRSGRQPGTFASQTLYEVFNTANGNGLRPNTAGNPEIGPEVSTEIEVGFDMALMQDRVGIEVSYYRTETDDLLVNQALAPSTGLTGNRQTNLGTLTNHGWEASIDSRLFTSDAISVDLLVAGDYTTNEITSLGEGVLGSGNFQLGWTYPNVSSPHILLDAALDGTGTTYDPASLLCDAGVPAVEGGPLINQGGDAVPCDMASSNELLLGPAYPNYTFSVAPTVSLMGGQVQVFAVAEGQYGKWNASIDAQYACSVYPSCLASVLRNDPFFLAGIGGPGEDERYKGRFAADFWKLRQIGARVNLPESILSRIGADRASLSVSASNIWNIWVKSPTDHSGQTIYDPESSTNGDQPANTALYTLPGISGIDAQFRITF